MRKGKIGVVFPIMREHVDRIFGEQKNVFVKFSHFKNLTEGSKIVFHVSGEKVLVGEGVIKTVQKLDPKDAWARYHNRIFLSNDEYNDYITKSPVGERKSKTITVLVLHKLRRFKKPIPPRRRMTYAGYYITQNDYEHIKRQEKSLANARA